MTDAPHNPRELYWHNCGMLVMAHRYLYHVLHNPLISDAEYDVLEAHAIPHMPPDHPIHKPGSDNRDDYTLDVVHLAGRMMHLNPDQSKGAGLFAKHHVPMINSGNAWEAMHRASELRGDIWDWVTLNQPCRGPNGL